MLSDSIRELRKAALDGAHGGRVMSGDDMIGLAAKLAAVEAQARNLETTVAQMQADRRMERLLVDPVQLHRRAAFGRHEARGQ